jgi:hypothetical protein
MTEQQIELNYRDMRAIVDALGEIKKTTIVFANVDVVTTLSKIKKEAQAKLEDFSTCYRESQDILKYYDEIATAKKTKDVEEQRIAIEQLNEKYSEAIEAEKKRRAKIDEESLKMVSFDIKPLQRGDVTGTSAVDAAVIFAIEPLVRD